MNLSFEEARDTYWKYYISLEKQFLETERYVEFDYINNGKTYSMEFMKLFQAVCSEIDVVGKKLAQISNEAFSPNKKTGINEWWFYITKNYPDFSERKCILLGRKVLQPWKRFDVLENPNENAKKFILNERSKPKGQTPSWWNDYNSVKHNRTGTYKNNVSNYTKANLQNLFSSFAALYLLEVALMEKTYFQEDNFSCAELRSSLFRDDCPFYFVVSQ